jgi:signal transduction histidine kinase
MVRASIENVIRNAIRYTPSNGLIHVETVSETIADQRFAIVRISDNGPGIPEEEIKSVLEPFYRADKAKHWRQDGFWNRISDRRSSRADARRKDRYLE